MRNLEQIAGTLAHIAHDGQMRKDNMTPYISHPEVVRAFCRLYGYDDQITGSVSWLHDTDEDTWLKVPMIRALLGDEIADGVYILSRNVDREAYKARLADAPTNIKMIKLCDTLHNIMGMPYLSPEGQARKVHDCETFYIPMAEEICPPIAKELQKYLDIHAARQASSRNTQTP
jgi:(p)ppGpp synthase/HD superfamily hydrolase